MNAKRLTLSERAHEDANTYFASATQRIFLTRKTETVKTARLYGWQLRVPTSCPRGDKCTKCKANSPTILGDSVGSGSGSNDADAARWASRNVRSESAKRSHATSFQTGCNNPPSRRGPVLSSHVHVQLAPVASTRKHIFFPGLHAGSSASTSTVPVAGSLKQTGRSAFDVTGVRINSLRLLSAHPHWIVQHVGVDVQLIIGADRIRDDTALTGGT